MGLLIRRRDLASEIIRGETLLYLAAQPGHAEIVKLLLANKATPNTKASWAYASVCGGRTRPHRCREDLLASGADVNAQDLHGHFHLL